MEDALKLPLFALILPEGFPYGKILLVEYDADAKWFAMLTLIAQALRMGHPTEYATGLHAPKEVRSHLSNMGVDLRHLEEKGTFLLNDLFSTDVRLKS